MFLMYYGLSVSGGLVAALFANAQTHPRDGVDGKVPFDPLKKANTCEKFQIKKRSRLQYKYRHEHFLNI
jgi:hypothetical protein